MVDEPFDLVFTDIIMPGRVDGWARAKAFRARWPQVSVIYASGYPLDSVPVADAVFLQRPYRIGDLVEAAEAKARAKHQSPAA